MISKASTVAIAVGLVLLATPAWAMSVTGQAMGPGRGVPGVLISDGVNVVKTDAQGRFRMVTSPGRVIAAFAPGGWRIKGRWWWPAGAVAGKELEITLVRVRPGKGVVAFVSDMHLRPGEPMRVWARLCRRLRRLRPELVVITGDSCFALDHAGPATPKVIRAVARALAQLPEPWAAVPGNHDVTYSGTKVNLRPWREVLGPARQVRMVGEVAVVMIDNIGVGKLVRTHKLKNCGRSSPETLKWLEAAVGQLPRGAPVVLASHFPLVAPVPGGIGGLYGGVIDLKTGLGLRDADSQALAVFQIMTKVKLLAMVHGHLHLPYMTRFLARGGRTLVVGLPAVSARWWHGDITWGPVRFPPGWMQARVRKVRGHWRISFKMHTLGWAGRR